MFKNSPKYFIRFKVPLIIYNNIKNGQISLQKEEKVQEEFWTELNKISKENLIYKSEDQIIAIKYKKSLQWAGKNY